MLRSLREKKTSMSDKSFIPVRRRKRGAGGAVGWPTPDIGFTYEPVVQYDVPFATIK